MKTLHASKSIHIVHLLKPHILYCNWIGPQSRESVLEGEAIMLELLQQNQFTKVLNDNTHVTGTWNTAVLFTVETWFPSMIAAGMQQFAWIFSPNIFAELSARRATPSHNVVKTFNDFHSAFDWLMAGK